MQKKSPWLSAWKNPVSGIKAYSRCLEMSDIQNDGDFRLLIASENRQLIIYKGVAIENQIQLMDLPIAITMI